MFAGKTALFGILLPALACASTPQKGDQVLRSEVDRRLNELASGKFDRAKEAAMFLIAAIRCHRRYGPEDGPLVRKPLEVLLRARRNNGLFGTGGEEEIRETTAWACQALRELDAGEYAEDLKATARAFAERFQVPRTRLLAALTPYREGSFDPRGAGGSKAALLLQKVQAWEGRFRRKRAGRKARPFEPFQQKALDWLLRGQKDGKWLVPAGPGGEGVPDPGITALCLAALASKPAGKRTPAETAMLEKGVRFLLASQDERGSFASYLPNYVTCTAVLALTKAGIGGAEKALAKAKEFLLAIQNVERNGYLPTDRDYGSIGYGNDRRGDVSNTQMALEALRATGVPPEHQAIEKALSFLRKAQNLPGKGSYKGTRRTEDGRRVTVEAGSDGGAAYYPGNSPFGYDETSEGSQVPRSYGSMTYALLKCYILAGLSKDDPRLQAALNWCLLHFSLKENPGVKPGAPEKTRYQGLYYYYLTLARALSLAEIDEVRGKDWRTALRKKLRGEQKPEGFWVNEKNGRWWEDNPLVCTAYVLLALSE